jgi:hypothetical protein
VEINPLEGGSSDELDHHHVDRDKVIDVLRQSYAACEALETQVAESDASSTMWPTFLGLPWVCGRPPKLMPCCGAPRKTGSVVHLLCIAEVVSGCPQWSCRPL